MFNQSQDPSPSITQGRGLHIEGNIYSQGKNLTDPNSQPSFTPERAAALVQRSHRQ